MLTPHDGEFGLLAGRRPEADRFAANAEDFGVEFTPEAREQEERLRARIAEKQ